MGECSVFYDYRILAKYDNHNILRVLLENVFRVSSHESHRLASFVNNRSD